MHASPYFSVIIPTLNEQKFIPKILKSLSKQTFRDFELIVADGKSSDKTKAVVEEYRSCIPGLNIILSDKANVGYQRNLGAKQANGTYFVFFDADVNIGTTFLEELHVASIKKNFPLCTTWIEPDSKKSIDKVMILLANLAIELAKEVNKPFAGGYNTVVRRDIFIKLKGFREDMKIGEDHDLALRAFKKDIEITILREPRLVMSLRRFRTEGTLKVLHKYAQAQIYALVKGPITKELFEYNMGGHVHRKKIQNSKLKIQNYLKRINNLQKILIDLLKE